MPESEGPVEPTEAADPTEQERGRSADAEPDPAVYTISDVRPSLDDEMRHRMRRYLISMSIRTVCFVLAVILHGWLRWAAAAAALVLPYIAVVMANAGPRRDSTTTRAYTPPRQALGTGRPREIGPRS